MEGPRFLLAIVLSIAVVLLVNVLFPPSRPEPGAASDSTLVDTLAGAPPPTLDTAQPPGGPAGGNAGAALTSPGVIPSADTGAAAAVAGAAAATSAPDGDTVWVQNDVARYGIATRGGALVSVELLNWASDTRPGPVQLVEPTEPDLLDFSLRVGDRVFPFDRVVFQPSLPTGDTLPSDTAAPLRLTATVNGATIELVYTFSEERYLVGLQGKVEGAGGDATLLVGLGPRLAINEADSAQDLRNMSYVVNSRERGIESVRVEKVQQNRVEEGPLTWVALRNKYFLAAVIHPQGSTAAFGGVLAEGGPQGVRTLQATLPLDRGGAFDLRLFFGPQEYGRLSALGEGLEDVNPYGWRVFRPIIRPVAHIVLWLLTALHNVLGIGYGWVLILFGIGIRVLLWPLNARAMRSQLKTMELQPRIKEIQAKYKEKPELLQKEMTRLYREEGFNPLGGCLPMLLPWPILITLFFVFQNTIEFRGVGFLWLPDLSQADPLYILPILMGVSLFALQYMNMRAAPQDNPQQKMMMYFMPVMMTVLFLRFASGLNLYYAASNIASLPQQIQIIGERKRARSRMAAKKE